MSGADVPASSAGGLLMSETLNKRMAAMIRAAAASEWVEPAPAYIREARAIAALLPDEDLEAARRIAMEYYSELSPHLAPILAGIRHGREQRG